MESLYDDNMSELVSFEAVDFFVDECIADEFEENDTIEAAAPILLDTEYTINDCNEQLDVFSLNLKANSTYEVILSDDEVYWSVAIVDTDGRYVERPRTALFGNAPYRCELWRTRRCELYDQFGV